MSDWIIECKVEMCAYGKVEDRSDNCPEHPSNQFYVVFTVHFDIAQQLNQQTHFISTTTPQDTNNKNRARKTPLVYKPIASNF